MDNYPRPEITKDEAERAKQEMLKLMRKSAAGMANLVGLVGLVWLVDPAALVGGGAVVLVGRGLMPTLNIDPIALAVLPWLAALVGGALTVVGGILMFFSYCTGPIGRTLGILVCFLGLTKEEQEAELKHIRESLKNSKGPA